MDPTKLIENSPSPGTPPAEPSTPANGNGGGEQRTFTQEELGRYLAEARRETREKVLKELQPRQEPPKADDKTDHESNGNGRVRAADVLAKVETLEFTLAFERGIRRYGLTDEQVEVLQGLAVAARPDDLSAWIDRTVKTFGLKASTSGSTSQPLANQPQTPTGPPASDRGGATPPSDSLRGTPLAWDRSDVDRIISEAKTTYEGIQNVRRKFMEGLKGVQIVIPRGPK